MLFRSADGDHGVRLLRSHAAGVGPLRPEEVGRALILVRAHQMAIPGSGVPVEVVEALVAAKDRMAHSPLGTLTDREREVLSHMAQGENNAAIARSLFLTERAVEKHINSIFAKLDLFDDPDTNRRVQAVLLFLQGSR